jgi:hypothetical protein
MKFSELSESAKDRVRNGEFLDYEWWDCTYEDAKNIAVILGIENISINFRGFWSQGDGASFNGRYIFPRGIDIVKAVTEYAPLDDDLKSFAERLTVLWVTLRMTGIEPPSIQICQMPDHYCHEMTMYIDVMSEDDNNCPSEEFHEELIYIFRDFARWIYKQLETKYEYLTSDDRVVERDEDYEEDGTLI